MEEKQKINLSAIMNKKIVHNNKDDPGIINKEKANIKKQKTKELEQKIVLSPEKIISKKNIIINDNEILKENENNILEKNDIKNLEKVKNEKIIEKLEKIEEKKEEIDADWEIIIKENIDEDKDNKTFLSIENIKSWFWSKKEENKEDIKENENKDELICLDNNCEKVEKKSIIESKEENKEKIQEKKELFSNYKADYKSEQLTILQRIKKLKNLPKTNYKFVFWLITFTAIWIWLLFYLNPKDHSIQNYKASIINIINKDEIEKKRLQIEEEYKKVQEELKWKIEYIKYSWFNFTVEFRTLNWEKNYKYNNIIYKNKKELDKVLNLEVTNIKRWIIKEILINNFKE